MRGYMVQNENGEEKTLHFNNPDHVDDNELLIETNIEIKDLGCEEVETFKQRIIENIEVRGTEIYDKLSRQYQNENKESFHFMSDYNDDKEWMNDYQLEVSSDGVTLFEDDGERVEIRDESFGTVVELNEATNEIRGTFK